MYGNTYIHVSAWIMHACTQILYIYIGFGRLSTSEGEEIEWITPGRVVLYDETSISGESTRAGKAAKSKVATLGERVDKGNNYLC